MPQTQWKYPRLSGCFSSTSFEMLESNSGFVRFLFGEQFSNVVSDIQGFVARDTRRKEIVVAIRGSASITDILMDSQIALVPLLSPGITVPSGTRVHSGFLVAWDSISIQLLAIMRLELAKHPDFSIVTTGHSLGGSIALLAAVALQQIFAERQVRTYSYGAPRTGNQIFAEYVNGLFGTKAYRVVHGNDGVPTVIPTSLGYHHHGIEYWQYTHPPSEQTTFQCAANGEDKRCSASTPSQGVNLAHTKYFGILVSTPFCL
ncbi:uncharacterized protein LACBIDRAFT_306423 [Laccaria bicolor S238N-H82]|uniref:Predicted protein n=1 Tax=Laccaria bicolor (strain S238N-H82 / ATCC MYA-4686) TaxID=486041 RepID=B0DMW0_LACBS|nr:uncharacterized protein LACBIDRAFT_306423 [Laccaria bicolor S238N-H82]EDR04041.1 predicted protein [Laccaria bicolor S238N-H82]|eukprot:XP_001885296.1 predicted protein [Laccaria bicolor S238N-H82]